MRSRNLVLASVALALSAPLLAQTAAPKPAATGTQEQAQVTLVQIDAVIMDKDGMTVTGLTKADFELKINGEKVVISNVDLLCPIGAMADPLPLKSKEALPAPIGPGVKRRIVFAFDYSFLGVTIREGVLDAAAQMIDAFKTDDEEVMIVALAGDVRIEQKFTKDKKQLKQSLWRMKHDNTLWPKEFPVGVSGQSYFDDFATMMDVLGAYNGSKAVVLFSQAQGIDSAMGDIWYDDVAAHANASNAAIYPSKPNALDGPGAGQVLSRLANQTGGRMPFYTSDISVSYRRAQRDLSCRYLISAPVKATESKDPEKLSVGVTKPGLQVRAPEMVQLYSEAEKQANRARAAYVDPGPLERPLVRAYGYSAAPVGIKKWDTLLAVNFPAPVGASGADVNIKAAVRRDNMIVGEYARKIHVDPPPGGGTSRNVTLLGDRALAPGQYDLTVVLSDATGHELVTAATDFVVPMVITDALVLRGPILGRVVPGGLFLRADAKDKTEASRLGQTLGPDNGFEPLIVSEIEANDKLLSYWSACVSGVDPIKPGAVVNRTISTAAGEPVKALDPIPYKLVSRGKDVGCQDMLETLPPNSLKAGDYRLDVVVAHPNGDVIAQGSSPFTVK